MNSTYFRLTAATLVGITLATTAVAGTDYKCDEPRTQIDRRACEAAKNGPDELRWFIQRVRGLESLDFSDYMTDAQLLAWRQAKEPTRTAQRATR
jgi:hypothetical protein